MSTHSVFDIDKIFEKNAVKFIIGWVIVLSLLYSTLSILRHNHFQSGGFDLGLFDQTVWQYSRFIWPYNTVKDRFILGDHLTLTLPLLAPLYYLWNDVRTLLVFQAFWITCSSLAIFFIARNRKFNPFVSFCIAFVYSLFYGIQFAVFFDFHSVVLGVGLLPWLAYFLETKKNKSLLIAILLVLLTQENMGLALASLGCIYIFKKAYRKTAVAFILGGIIASFIASKIITLLSPVGFQYWPQLSLQPIKIIAQFFDSPEKRQVWLYSFAWFSFFAVTVSWNDPCCCTGSCTIFCNRS